MERNDSLLISASYFWSNALNAFIFGHGPMTITLADIYMLIGLRITGSVQPYEYLSAGSKRLAKIADYTGWASYILNHIEDGSAISEREYVAFFRTCGWKDSFSSGHLVVQPIITNSWWSTYHWAKISLLENIC